VQITEASDSLGLEEEMSPKWEKYDQIERDQKRLKKEIAGLKESKGIYGEVLNDTEDQLEAWDKLRDEAEEGRSVYAPKDGGKKRKRSDKSQMQRKKRISEKTSDDDDDSVDDATSEEEDDIDADTNSQREPLTIEEIEAKITELKSTKKEARLQRRELDVKMLTLREELKNLDAAHSTIEAEMSTICISGRNKYSKGAIQQDVSLS
jgi:chromosome segregation ATPase